MRKILGKTREVIGEEGSRRRLLSKRAFWTLSGVAFIAIIAIAFPLYSTSTPGFCRSCHLMEKYYTSWEQSTHAKVGCTPCHVKPDLWSQIKHKTEVWKEPYLAWVIRVKEVAPEEVKPPHNESCLACHTEDREASPSGDLKIPHRDHVEKYKVKCAYCHYRMVHTDTPQGLNTPPMERCFNCHDGKKAPKDCTACHTSMGAPKDHRTDWTVLHGAASKKNKSYCDKCHAAFPAFCMDCHSKRPTSHRTTWWKDHEANAAARKATCNVCHGKNFCNMCHAHVHPKGWTTHHAADGTKRRAFCITCHNESAFCSDCHAKKNVGR